ncbi:Outer membrane protein assembly factor BamB [uncultured archaeon]|nr:Outer membrane protein assembly factor BamB [uncultured archaeon]
MGETKNLFLFFTILLVLTSFLIAYIGNSDTTSLSEWNMFHRTLNHSGYYPDSINMTNFGKLWNYSMNNWSYYSSPAISGGILYICSYDKKLYAINISNYSKICNFSARSVIRTSPAVADGIVYFGSNDFDIYALNATTCTKIWNYTTGAQVYSSPLIYQGIVYFGSEDYNVYALNATNGTKIWNFSTRNVVGTSSPIISNNILYIGSNDKDMYALNISNNGSKIWNYTTR